VKRVLLITDVTAPGGVDTYCCRLFEAAKKAGWRPAVLMDEGPGSDGLFRALMEMGADVERGPLYHRAFPEDARRAATKKALDSFCPAVVHAICPAPWNTVVPRETVLEAGLPLVFTEQYVAGDFTFAADLHPRIARLYREAAAVVAVSRDNARLLTKVYGFPGDRLVVIPNAAPADRTGDDDGKIREGLRREMGLAPDVLLSVTVARYEKQKGLDVFIRAAASLPEDALEKIHFALVGEGSERAFLEDLAVRLKVENRFSFLGWRPDAGRLLPAFDLFILPSRSEGQPFALVEALAAGLPVIAADVSGVAEVLDGGRGGVLVPGEEPDALAREIAAFVRDPGPLKKLAKAGERHVREHYDLGKNMKKTVGIWEGILSRK